MADRSQQAQRVFDALEDKIAQMGLELVDVAFVKEGSARFLRVYIDKTGGVTLDDCTDVSHMADPVIDNELKITSHDYLEVSSPGFERPLKTERDFARYQNEWVEVKLYKAVNQRKKYEGRLAPCSDKLISIELEGNTIMSFDRDDVAKVNRIVKFD